MLAPLLFWVLSTGGGIALPSQCNNYKIFPADHDRSRDNVFSPKIATIPCDDVPDGSYRFSTGEISTSCVPVNHCGTTSTIWMKDPIPAVGESSLNEFCVNHKTSSAGETCCLFSFSVNVSNCDGFLVYDFRSDDILCPSGYCTQNISTCPEGQSSKTGFAPCTESYPVMSGPPTLKPPVITANGEDFHQTCVINCNESRADFKVTWLFDDVEYKTVVLTNGTTHDSLTSTDWIGHVGQHVKCQVTSYRQYASNAPHSPARTSQSYYGGVSVSSTSIIVSEDKQEEITLTSTLPVVCNNTSRETCHLDLAIKIKGANTHGLEVANGCLIRLRADDWAMSSNRLDHNFTVATSPDIVMKGEARYLVQLQVSPSAITHAMWNSYVTTEIQVTTVDVEYYYCLAFGDPHVVTTRPGIIVVYVPGDFMLYKAHSANGNFLNVQIRLWSPHRQGSSICAVAVQYNDALIIVDMCTTQLAATAPVITQGERTPDDLRIYMCGSSYRVITGDGLHITIYIHEFHLDIRINLPPSYPIDVNGVCNFTMVSTSQDHFLSLSKADPWILSHKESLFLDAGVKFYEVQKQRHPSKRFCTCGDTASCDPFSRFTDAHCTVLPSREVMIRGEVYMR